MALLATAMPAHAGADELAPLDAGLVIEVTSRVETLTLTEGRYGTYWHIVGDERTMRFVLATVRDGRIEQIDVEERAIARLVGLRSKGVRTLRARNPSCSSFTAVHREDRDGAPGVFRLLDGLPMRATLGTRSFEVGVVIPLDATGVRDLLMLINPTKLTWLDGELARAELTLRSIADDVATFDFALDVTTPEAVFAIGTVTYDVARDLPRSIELTGRGPAFEVEVVAHYAYPTP